MTFTPIALLTFNKTRLVGTFTATLRTKHDKTNTLHHTST